MLDPHAIENDVLEFFFVFSRIEFALKELRYLTAESNANAAPNWDRFVKKYKLSYKPSEDVQDSANYLVSNPPKRQKVYKDEAGKLKARWETFQVDPNAPELKTLVDIVKVVRNNLFHGGKYGEKGWGDKDRVSMLSNLRRWS